MVESDVIDERKRVGDRPDAVSYRQKQERKLSVGAELGESARF